MNILVSHLEIFCKLYSFKQIIEVVLILNSKKMEAKEQVLEAMKKEGTPLNAGKIVELTGLDRKVVDKAMTALKKEEAIISPKRCYWQAK